MSKRKTSYYIFIMIFLVVTVGSRGLNAQTIWANNGEDKVTQDDLRATNNPLSVMNSVWNGSEINLFAARNETVAFCLIIESPGADLHNVTVTFNELSGPEGNSIVSVPASGEGVFNWVDRPIELFYIRYLQIKGVGRLVYEHYDERHVPERFRRPWTGDGVALEGTGWVDRPDHDKFYPDIAIPLELESPFNIAADQNQSIWVDIYVPSSVPAGIYSGTIVVNADEMAARSIPVELEVMPFSLPDEPSLKTMLVISPAEDMAKRYVGVEYPSDPDDLVVMKHVTDLHYQMAHRHRIELIEDADDNINDQPQADMLPRFNGELFTAENGYAGPGTGTGNKVYSIGLYGSWGWQDEGEASMWAHTDNWVNWFTANAPDVDYFLYLIDESDNFPQIEQWSEWINNNPGSGSQMPSFATTDFIAGMLNAPSLNIPCGSANLYSFPPDVAEQYAQQIINDPNKRLWNYNGSRPFNGTAATEEDGIAFRVTAWAQFKKHIERWFIWEGTYYNNYQGGMGETNVFQSAFTFGAISGFDEVYGETGWNYSNGDGVLYYPGTDMVYPEESYNLPGPFASLRLKHWRRGIQDGDYLTLAYSYNPQAVDSIVNNIIPKVLWDYEATEPSDPTWIITGISWSTDPDVWEAARRQLARIIMCGMGLTEYCDCLGDLNADGITDQLDLGLLLAAYRLNGDGDLNGDGWTDMSDLGLLLSDYGCHN